MDPAELRFQPEIALLTTTSANTTTPKTAISSRPIPNNPVPSPTHGDLDAERARKDQGILPQQSPKCQAQ